MVDYAIGKAHRPGYKTIYPLAAVFSELIYIELSSGTTYDEIGHEASSVLTLEFTFRRGQATKLPSSTVR
jgi:hypothetical protein